MKLRLTVAVAGMLLLAGCTGMSDTQQRALTGTVGGAAVGGVIGAIGGNAGLGAVVGAGAGLAGGLIYDFGEEERAVRLSERLRGRKDDRSDDPRGLARPGQARADACRPGPAGP